MIDNGWSGFALPFEVAEGVNMAMFGLSKPRPDPPNSLLSWCDKPEFEDNDLVGGKPSFDDLGFTLVIGDKSFPIPNESLFRKRKDGKWISEIGVKATSACFLGDTFLKHVVAVHDLENKKMIFRGK